MSAASTARAALAPIAFLTRVPVGRLAALDARDVTRGAPLFPLVGAAVGGVSGLLADSLVPQLPPLVVGALAVGVGAVVTGAMHLDALADTADALGGVTRERALEIMRDHAIGAYGAVALVLVCVVDAAALAALAVESEALLAGLVAGGAGRAAILPVSRALPYARPGAGQGRVLDGLGWSGAVLGIGIAVALGALVGRPGLAAVAAAAVTAILLALGFRAWLGGVTGDALGATAKLCETAALVAYLAAAR